jgi:hypothetical protein
MLMYVQWAELEQFVQAVVCQKVACMLADIAVGRVREIHTTCHVPKNGMYVGGCTMGRVRTIHTSCGVP